jgi:hypothetical protein
MHTECKQSCRTIVSIGVGLVSPQKLRHSRLLILLQCSVPLCVVKALPSSVTGRFLDFFKTSACSPCLLAQASCLWIQIHRLEAYATFRGLKPMPHSDAGSLCRTAISRHRPRWQQHRDVAPLACEVWRDREVRDWGLAEPPTAPEPERC